MDRVSKHTHANSHTPETSCQQRNVEECRRSHAEHNRRKRIEEYQRERKTHEVPSNLSIPSCTGELVAVEDGGGNAVDNDSEEANHAYYLVQRTFGDEPFFEDVGETIESCAEGREKVAFDFCWAAIGAGDVVGGDEDAHAADADQDSEDLSPAVADFEDEEGDDYYDNNGPEIDELCLSMLVRYWELDWR